MVQETVLKKNTAAHCMTEVRRRLMFIEHQLYAGTVLGCQCTALLCLLLVKGQPWLGAAVWKAKSGSLCSSLSMTLKVIMIDHGG